MYHQLAACLQPPATAYAPSDVSIWTDAHISSQMLAAHLDPSFDGASRPHRFIDRSVAWIKEILPPQKYRSLLDVGCGPGLYAERFCRAGYRVTGVDFSSRSINYATAAAQKQRLDIRYVCQNYLQLSSRAAFDLATLIYCDYGALSGEDRKTVLQKIHRALRPGGKLLLDVFSMRQYGDFTCGRSWEDHPAGGFWSPAAHLEVNSAGYFADDLTLRQTAVITETEIRRFYLWDTYFTRESLAAEVQAAGFAVCACYGDVSGAPYRQSSPTLAVLLTRQ